MLQPIELVLGSDARWDLPITIDGVPPQGGIAGWSFEFRVFAARSDQDDAALITVTTDNGGIAIFDAAAGLARLLITKEQSAALAPGKYFFRLTSLDPAGNDDVPAHGWLTVVR